MPNWLEQFLREWAPYAGLAVFALGLIGACITAVIKMVQSLFTALITNGVIISKSSHLQEVSFYATQVAACKEAGDRRIAELTRDLEDLRSEFAAKLASMEKDRDKWEARFWESARGTEFIIKRDTPPHGIRRPETGIGS